MNFTEIAENRQSCRKYDPTRPIEPEKLNRILETARLITHIIPLITTRKVR